MLKAFQYTSIALLCSMTVACSSGKGNSDSQAKQDNKPKQDMPKPDTPKPDTPKPDTPKPDTPKPDTPKPDTPKPDTPKPDTPKPDTPKPDTPKPDTPKPDTPKPDTPKPDTPKPDTPKPDTPKPDTPKPDTPKPDTPKQEMPSKFIVTAQEAKVQGGHTSSVQSDDYKHHLEALVIIAEEGGVSFKQMPQTSETKDVKGKPEDDVGLSLLKADPNSISNGFGKVHIVNAKGQLNLLLARDADLNNWKYQNFGMLTIPTAGSSAFVSFGQESKTIPVSGNATYKGIALGSAWDREKPIDSVSGQIASELEMRVNFSDKSLTFMTSNTKGYSGSGAVANESERIKDYSAWDLKGTATWNGDQKAFLGKIQLKSDGQNVTPNAESSLKGSFYGPEAAEIGGTFHLKTDDKDYRGAFGGKK